MNKIDFSNINLLIPKRIFVIFFDISLCIFSLWLAFFLRMDRFYFLDEIPIYPLIVSISLMIILIFSFQIHKSINRHSGLETFIELSKALIIYSIIFASIFTLNTVKDVPRTIGIIQPILLSFSILSSRAIIRYVFLILSLSKQKEKSKSNCLIYGAGSTGIQLSRIIKGDNSINFVGFLDDNKELVNTKIDNKFIYSPTDLRLN